MTFENWDDDEAYSFVCIVSKDGDWVSTNMLEKADIPEKIARLLVHGPFEEAVRAMAEWGNEYSVIKN